MRLHISKPYLQIPVRPEAGKVYFVFRKNTEVVYLFEAEPCEDRPEVVYEADLRDYLGQELELCLYRRREGGRLPMHFELFPENGEMPEILPDTIFTPVLSDTKEAAGDHPRRPLVHFTAEKGWINDPNGCFRDDQGLWHLYFQHNPFGSQWGNMHWGHAVSTDLVHWEEQDEALFIDAQGTMFSGCAVKDTGNRSGLGKDGVAPVLFYYTSAGKQSTQCLAVSNDSGKTLKKYEGNPVIPELARGSRDPKLVYDRDYDRYLCPLYLEKHEFAIFETRDLLHFTMIQKLELPQDIECPNLYPLTADDGRKLWVFSGAGDRYLVGEMQKDGFVPVQDARQLSFDSQSYAAQVFFRESDEEPTIRIAWDRSPIPYAPFNGAMTTPQIMGLRNVDGAYVLTVSPIPGLLEAAEETEKASDVRELRTEIPSKAFLITMDTGNADFTAELSGLRFSGNRDGVTIHGIHFTKRGPFPPETKDIFLPRIGREHVLRIIADTNSAEFYLNDMALTTVSHDFSEGEVLFELQAEAPVKTVSLAVFPPVNERNFLALR